MVLAVHILVGATIATKAQNPILGLLFAFLSHYFLDMIPHREYHIWNILERRWKSSLMDFIKLFLDIFLGFFLVMVISKNYFPAFLGGFFAVLPDALIFLSKPLYQLNKKIHWFENAKLNKKPPLFWGIATQVLILFLAIFLR